MVCQNGISFGRGWWFALAPVVPLLGPCPWPLWPQSLRKPGFGLEVAEVSQAAALTHQGLPLASPSLAAGTLASLNQIPYHLTSPQGVTCHQVENRSQGHGIHDREQFIYLKLETHLPTRDLLSR